MNPQLKDILESLILSIDVLNNELMRMARSEQFTSEPNSLRLIADIRERCLCSLQNIQTIERKVYREMISIRESEKKKE